MPVVDGNGTRCEAFMQYLIFLTLSFWALNTRLVHNSLFCDSRTWQTYTSSYDAWGNVTSRIVNGMTATLSYDDLDSLTKWDAGSNRQEQYSYDTGGNNVLDWSNGAGSTTMTVCLWARRAPYR